MQNEALGPTPNLGTNCNNHGLNRVHNQPSRLYVRETRLSQPQTNHTTSDQLLSQVDQHKPWTKGYTFNDKKILK